MCSRGFFLDFLGYLRVPKAESQQAESQTKERKQNLRRRNRISDEGKRKSQTKEHSHPTITEQITAQINSSQIHCNFDRN